MLDKIFDDLNVDLEDFVYSLFCTILVCVVAFGSSFLGSRYTTVKEVKSYLKDTYSAIDIDLNFKKGSFVADNKYYDINCLDFSDKTFNIVAKDGTVTKVQLEDIKNE